MNFQKKERFTKAAVNEWVRGRIDRLAENHGFNLGNGYSQVERSSPARNRAYGEIMALQAMIDVFRLGEEK